MAIKKFTVADLGLNMEGLPEEQKKFMQNIGETIVGVMNKSLEGVISKDDVVEQFKTINETIKSYDADKFAQVLKDNEDLVSQVKNLGESIEKMKQKGIGMETINKLDEKLEEIMKSEKFTAFAEGRTSTSGKFDGITLKEVSMSGNYEGDRLITQQTGIVVSQATNKRIHVRDVMTTLQGDPNFPNLAFAQIYDVDRNARYVAENGTLPESSFKVKEVNALTSRVGHYINISKRMLKSRAYIRSLIINMMPEGIYNAEDFGLLFGDGTGDNPLGIINHTGVISADSIVNDTIIDGKAGAVKAVTSAEGGKACIVELTKAYDTLQEGMKITFANAVKITGLNATFDVVKLNDRQLYVPVTYVAAETPESITFTVNNSAFKSVEAPNSGDVIAAASAVMTFAQYAATAIVLNPITLFAIKTEKDTQGRSLNLVQEIGGRQVIAGMTVIPYSGIPAGKYFIGDFVNGANIVSYSPLTLEFAEDVNTKLKNQVVLIAQEEFILAVYMPWAFSYGDLTKLKTAITKA